jgi:ribosomal protein S18 acetylase RimI-like enzyme
VSTAPDWRRAGTDDRACLLAMMRDFYAEDRIGFDPVRVERALAALLAEPACGEALLWLDAQAAVVGYAVWTRCFSLEQGGWHALLDELYLAPAGRGRGRGARALEIVAARVRMAGLARLRLEVNRHNAAARRLYLRRGFRDEARDLLTLDLAGGPA